MEEKKPKKKPQPFAFRWEWAVRDFGPEEWTPGLRAILYTLRTWMDNDTGRGVVSQGQLAQGAGVARSTVSELLKRAEADGWLQRWKHRGEGRRWAITYYQAVIPPEVKVLLNQPCRLSGQPSPEPCRDYGVGLSGLPPEAVDSQDTNSFNSLNSGRSAPDGAGSPEGSPFISLSEEEGVDIEHHHRELLARLSEDERREVRTAVVGSTDFPVEHLTAGMLASLPEETLEGLWEKVRAREEEAA